MTKLTAKQQMFVEEYLIDLNATQAAIRAGYSEHTAASVGCENLRKPYIQDAIQIAMKDRAERTQLTADSILKEIATIAYDKEEQANNRLRGLELLGKHKILFSDKLVHDGGIQIHEVRRKVVYPDNTDS